MIMMIQENKIQKLNKRKEKKEKEKNLKIKNKTRVVNSSEK